MTEINVLSNNIESIKIFPMKFSIFAPDIALANFRHVMSIYGGIFWHVEIL